MVGLWCECGVNVSSIQIIRIDIDQTCPCVCLLMLLDADCQIVKGLILMGVFFVKNSHVKYGEPKVPWCVYVFECSALTS